jgi:hypothetical protein
MIASRRISMCVQASSKATLRPQWRLPLPMRKYSPTVVPEEKKVVIPARKSPTTTHPHPSSPSRDVVGCDTMDEMDFDFKLNQYNNGDEGAV